MKKKLLRNLIEYKVHFSYRQPKVEKKNVSQTRELPPPTTSTIINHEAKLGHR